MKSVLYISCAMLVCAVAGCGASGSTEKCAATKCTGAAICDGVTGMCVTQTCDPNSGGCVKQACDPNTGVCTKEFCDAATGRCVDKCAGVTCSSSQTCDASNGTCVSKCAGVTCGSGNTCDSSSGACIGQCAGAACSSTEMCDSSSGTCVSKCAGVTCSGGLSCNANTGTCVNKCAGVTCGSTEMCDSNTGTCVSKCAGVTCSGGQICNAGTGTCIDPPPPSLGAIIERMGRPAINTALTNPFDVYGPSSTPEVSNVTKDRYNSDANVSNWQSWSGAIALHLGIFDALDSTGATAATVTSNLCGNQFGYGLLGPNGYSLLATVLAGDALQLDTSKTTCQQYLGVEIAAITATGSDCGGRRPEYDVIDTTYSLLVAGTASGVADGISMTTAPTATFPFLASPL